MDIVGFVIYMPSQLYFHYPFTDKFCKRCLETKPVEMFSPANKKTEQGIRILYKYWCKECVNKYNKSKKIYKPKKVKFTDEEIRIRLNECVIKRRKSMSPEEIENERQRSRDWYYRNREKSITSVKKWRQENKERLKVTVEKYRENNRKRISKVHREYVNKRLSSDSLYKLKTILRGRIKDFIRKNGCTKRGSTSEIILGTSYELVRIYIESKFVEGMTWGNHGFGKNKWHIDHIIPLSSANTEEEVHRLFHYTNLQPLWAIDNLRKSNKMPIM